jgi:hypothetical protein
LVNPNAKSTIADSKLLYTLTYLEKNRLFFGHQKVTLWNSQIKHICAATFHPLLKVVVKAGNGTKGGGGRNINEKKHLLRFYPPSQCRSELNSRKALLDTTIFLKAKNIPKFLKKLFLFY